WFFYIIALLPVIRLLIADRYTYFPLIGLFIIIAWGLVEISKFGQIYEKVIKVTSLIVMFILIGISWQQVWYWQSSETIFRKTLEVSPDNVRLNVNLGMMMMKKNQLDEAVELLNRALEINPNHPDAHYNLAAVLLKQGKTAEAVEHYEEALKYRP